jgi:S-adenosylhomocysteine hydrolase
MENKIYEVPPAIDEKIARYALAAMGLEIDRLTAHQKRYRNSSIS